MKTIDPVIKDSWNRIVSWGNKNAPAMLEDLNPGASEEEIGNLEKILGRQLSNDFRSSLLLYNGENDGWPCKVFADLGAYLSTSRIIETWKLCQEITKKLSSLADDFDINNEQDIIEQNMTVIGPVRPRSFISDWIPIMECNGDVFWAIDFYPAKDGKKGQVIEVDWELSSWKVIATSLTELLSDYANSLEMGEYQIVNGLPTREDI